MAHPVIREREQLETPLPHIPHEAGARGAGVSVRASGPLDLLARAQGVLHGLRHPRLVSLAGTPAVEGGSSGHISRLNLIADLALVISAVWIATPAHVGADARIALVFALLAGALWAMLSSALRHYDATSYKREAFDDAALVSVLAISVSACLACLTLGGSTMSPVPKVGRFTFAFWPAALVLRLLVFRSMSARQGPLEEALVVGTGPMGRLTGEDLERRGHRRVLGYLSFEHDVQPDARAIRCLGAAAELERVLRKAPVSEVYIAGDALKNGEAMQAVIRVCEKLGVAFALPAYSFRLERARPVLGRAISDGYLHYELVDAKPTQRMLKRLFDIFASAAALFVLLPLFAVIAALIKLTYSGPVFFKQVRAGLHGRPFEMLKFRSMVVNAEELKPRLESHNERTGPVFKMKNDPRITKVGRFIRKYSIDELPQLVNVLRGEMSLVGPRPPVPSEVAKYEAWQLRRLSMRPGLTCTWQVSPDRYRVSFQEWMYLDLQYIDNWNLLQDFELMLKTIPVVLKGTGVG